MFLSPQYSFFETVCLIFRSQACIIKPEPLKRMIRSRRLSSFPWNLNLLKFFVADATSINSLVHWPWLCSRFLKAYKRELCSILPEYWNCAYSYEFQQILCHWENWCFFFSWVWAIHRPKRYEFGNDWHRWSTRLHHQVEGIPFSFLVTLITLIISFLNYHMSKAELFTSTKHAEHEIRIRQA